MAPKEKKGKKKYFPESKVKNKQDPKQENAADSKQTRPNNSYISQNRGKKKNVTVWQKIKRYKDRYFNWRTVSNLTCHPHYMCFAACFFLLLEAALNIFIIENVKYTEIDWVAYMQEVEGFQNGIYDYTKLKGDTGPLVYPAGFLYIFSALAYVTNNGLNIRLAQYIFAGIYLLTLALVFRIFHKSKKLPPYILVFVCCLSYRIHSIFILRLFNDTIAMMIFYGALNFFISGWWTFGSIFYSFAVSVKMNILLFSPALLMTYVYSLGVFGTVVQLSICAAIQILLGLPFLLTNPYGYVNQAFNIGRVFLYEWTVNWRFLPEEIFVNRFFHVGLLFAHLAVLGIFAYTHWQRYLIHYGSLQSAKLDVSCQLFLLPMFMSNFIGIAFSRSLHYQFYVWYFHSIPYLLWSTKLSIAFRLLLLGLIELSWNIFPSTWWSSALLHVCHVTLLTALMMSRPSQERIQSVRKKLLKGE